MAKIALVHQCVLAGELIWIQRRGRQQGRRVLRGRQTAVGSPRVGNILRIVCHSHRCVTREHRRVQGVTWRSSTGVTTDERRRGGRVNGVKAVRTSPLPDWDASPTHGIVLGREVDAVERMERSSDE